MFDCDVLIIGFGPTAGTLANLLALQGNSIIVIEKEQSLFPLPRAVHFDDEVMRVFQTIGISEKFIKQTIINKGTKFIDKNGKTLLDWPRPKIFTENGWRPSYRFHQPDLERRLRAKLKNYKKVNILQNTEAISISCKSDNVETICLNKKKEKLKFKSKYLVGCDGGNSFTRLEIKTPLIDLGFKQRWAVFDLILSKKNSSLPDRTIQFCNSKRPATYCRNVGLRRRWEFALHDNETNEEVLLNHNVWNFLKPWVSKNDAILERKTIYTFKSAVAKKWMKNRIFIAGDAAHLTPPFMGQGMCAGIRDVSNLAWKLSYCLNFGHNKNLLQSYQKERMQNVIEYIKTTMKMGEFINEIGSEKISNTIFKNKDGSFKMSTIKPKLGFGLGDRNDKNCGKIFPNIKLNNNSYLDEKYSKELLLITKSKLKKKLEVLNLNTITEQNSKNITHIFLNLKIDAVILRPDRFILSSLKESSNIHNFINFNQNFLNNFK